LARPAETGVFHVSKGKGLIRFFKKLFQPLGNGGRRGQVGVAEAEVSNVLLAVFLFHFIPGFEHTANPGTVTHLFSKGFGY
jgi:hypothetical protein